MRFHTYLEPLDASPGTYALLLQAEQDRSIQVGKWGILDIQPGYYVYIGSAFGPGGVRARVSRHFRRGKKMRWHIDYLRAAAEPAGVWTSTSPIRLEHQWAQALEQNDAFHPIPGFGSSDCTCTAHLFYTRKRPLADQLDFSLVIRAEFGKVMQKIKGKPTPANVPDWD